MPGSTEKHHHLIDGKIEAGHLRVLQKRWRNSGILVDFLIKLKGYKTMLKFVTNEERIDVLTSEEGLALGYIDEDNVFFPNNKMMFRVERMLEIARFMQKQKLIQGDIPYGIITAHYEIKDVDL